VRASSRKFLMSFRCHRKRKIGGPVVQRPRAYRGLLQTLLENCRIAFAVKESDHTKNFRSFCEVTTNDSSFHVQPCRFRNSARTSSHEVPSFGFLRNSSARRSSSANCSVVRSGSYPSAAIVSQIWSANRTRSAKGNALACSNSSALPMSAIYCTSGSKQVRIWHWVLAARATPPIAIPARHSAFRIPHSHDSPGNP